MNPTKLHLRPANPANLAVARSSFSSRAAWRTGLALAAGLITTIAQAQSNYATPYFFTTLAGTTTSGSTDGTLTAARFFMPNGVAVEANGTVYVADTNNHTIRKITFFGVVTTIAGLAGNPGTANGTGTAARFNLPRGIAVDSAGNVYVGDTSNSAIRKITPAGEVLTLAGGTAGSLDGTGAAARFLSPNGVAVDAAGNVYVADTGNNSIRKITAAGVVTNLAGGLSPTTFGSADGAGAAARFASPRGVAVDGSGNVYVADRDNNLVRKITPGGVVTTLAGLSNGISGSTDGTGPLARFSSPYAVASDVSGNVYVADSSNKTIRKITPAGVVTTLAGLAGANGNADGTGSVVRFMDPQGIAVDGAGNLYVADTNNHSIRMSVFAPVIAPHPVSQVVTPGANATLTSGASSNVAITYQWQKDGTPIPGATVATPVASPNAPTTSTSSVTITNIQTPNLGNYTLVATNMAGSSTSNPGVISFTPPPSFVTHPVSQSVAPGANITFTATATSTFPITYQWQKDNVAIPGATTTALLVNNVQVANLGNYTLVATNSVGSTTSNPAALAFVVSTAGRLTNLSIRTNAGTAAQTLIVGFVVGGANITGTKPLLIRGAGPSLGVFNVAGFLVDPSLSVYSGEAVVASNDNWGGDPLITSVGARVGAFPFGAPTTLDAALYSATLNPGSYTVQITGNGGTTGIALAEIYDATQANDFTLSSPRLINVSARTQVGLGADILITGFNISGTTSKTLLIRAVGPTLSVFGVTGALVDPKLDLFSGSTLIQTNDNWGGGATIAGVATGVGAFALDGASRDAVLLVTLQPGSYTAQVSGVGNTTGVALVEIYDVP